MWKPGMKMNFTDDCEIDNRMSDRSSSRRTKAVHLFFINNQKFKQPRKSLIKQSTARTG